MNFDGARNAQFDILRKTLKLKEVATDSSIPAFVDDDREGSVAFSAAHVVAASKKVENVETLEALHNAPPLRRASWRPEDDIAIGLRQDTEGKGFKLVALYQRPGMDDHELMDELRRTYGAELEVQYMGRAHALWNQAQRDPLCAGLSLGHPNVTVGTLGCFAKDRETGALGILSNNHVLANMNDAELGDLIYQPGPMDGGRSSDAVGELDRFLPLDLTGGPNRVDCAWAELWEARELDWSTIRDNDGNALGQIAGPNPVRLGLDDTVQKIGRTTGHSWGVVSAVNIMNLRVKYGPHMVVFQDASQIETTGKKAFAQGGDSGSLILTEDFKPAGLLFAASKSGGTGNKGLTFACDLLECLDALSIDLVV